MKLIYATVWERIRRKVTKDRIKAVVLMFVIIAVLIVWARISRGPNCIETAETTYNEWLICRDNYHDTREQWPW